MTLAIQDRGVVATTAGSSATNTVTSAAFAPAANALLVVVAQGYLAQSTMDFTISNTHTGTGAWTQVTDSRFTTYRTRCSIFYAQCGASPGSGTVTVTRTAATLDQWLIAQFCSVTGAPASPTIDSITNTGLTSSLSLTLAGGFLSTSMQITGLYNESNDPTIPSGFTQLHKTDDGGGSFGAAAYEEVPASATITWTATGTNGDVGAAISIPMATVVPTGATPRVMRR